MSFELKGKLTDTSGNALPQHTIKAFDKDPIYDLLGDETIDSTVTLDDGTFKMTFTKDDFKKFGEFWDSNMEPQLYLNIYDPDGNPLYETPIISDPFLPFNNPAEVSKSESVVVGSGFGGTIVSLSIVNQLTEEDKSKLDADKRKVVILERGQWWVSHELPQSPGSHEFEKNTPPPDKGIREYLETNDTPYRTWAYPDNVNGLSKFLNSVRIMDRRGLYDYRISKRVHTLAASGVGGGSLVYTNVTEKPDQSVLDAWDTTLNLGINSANLVQYFDMAKGFIGVNKIPTTTALGSIKLPKAKAFQDAAKKIQQESPLIVKNESSFNSADPDQSPFIEDLFAVDLSITDFPYRKDDRTLFNKRNSLFGMPPAPVPIPDNPYQFVKNSVQTNSNLQEKLALLLRKYFDEPNICERQGRCALGCIPGARHTNNKKIFEYLNHSIKKKHLVVLPLCEVYDIEPLTSSTAKYKVYYTDYGARDRKQANFSWNVGPKSYKIDVKIFRLVDGGKQKTIECNKLVLAAGAIGSTEILLKAVHTKRTAGQKLDLSPRLGMGYSTNGDLLGVINPTKTDIHATRGPIVTSAIRFNEGPGFVYTLEDSSIPKMFSGVSRFLSKSSTFRTLLGLIGSGSMQQVIGMFTQSPSGVTLEDFNVPLQVSEQDLTKTMLLSGMGTDTSDGTLKLQDSWKNNPNRDMNALNVLDVDFDLSKLVPLFAKMTNSMERIAKHMGEDGLSSFSTPLWDPADANGSVTIVLHNLGGCSMGKDRSSGVVDSFGKVYKGNGASSTDTYTDFYVVDGAIVPTSLGVNSSLTISALAFRAAEGITGLTNYLPVEPVPYGMTTVYFPK